MALTNFTLLTDEQKTVWARDVWRQARNLAFVTRFTGTDSNAMVHRITELTKTERGDRAVVTLVPDLEEDGIAGDSTLEGNEEAIKAYDQVIQIDQLRQANRSEGRMAEQRSIVMFREKSRDVLAYWLADRMDQMAFLALSGVDFSVKNNGAARVGSGLTNLSFNADVTAPTTNRYFNWDATGGDFNAGDTSTVTATDLPSYDMLVNVKALMTDRYIRPIRENGGIELFHVFLAPQAMAALKLDSNFILNVRHAMPRAKDNQLFKGTAQFDSVFVDGMAIHTHRHVFNTQGLTDTVDKWGAGNDVEGCAMLVCGAQSLAMADIGPGFWVEKEFDYGNQPGISYGKIFGYKKPVFRTQYQGTAGDEDFGLVRINVAMPKVAN